MTQPACRYCRTPLSTTLIDLGTQPLANSYLRDRADIATERSFPLKVMTCDACHLTQVTTEVPADAIFDDQYAYFSSYSSSWVAHAERYTTDIIGRYGLAPESAFIVEAASNDGYLLQHFVKRGYRSLGVEPADNCAEAAREKGVETLTAFFNVHTAEDIVSEYGLADLTAANNVLAHVPDIAGFLGGFRTLLKADGVSTFEFPHLLKLTEQVQFDTIYHEHYSYLSLIAVERFCRDAGLAVFDLEELHTHGGSLRVHVCRADGPRAGAVTRAVEAVRDAECAAQLDRPEGYGGFAAKAEAIRGTFLDVLSQLKEEGKRVAAYGAAAKGNTFLNYCGVTADQIDFVVDSNPAKQRSWLPGSHIPVDAPDRLKRDRPDVILILPWNLADEIAHSHAYVCDWGGRFMVASPEPRFL